MLTHVNVHRQGVPPSSASAVTTGVISLAQGDNLEPADRAETNRAHGKPQPNTAPVRRRNLIA